MPAGDPVDALTAASSGASERLSSASASASSSGPSGTLRNSPCHSVEANQAGSGGSRPAISTRTLASRAGTNTWRSQASMSRKTS